MIITVSEIPFESDAIAATVGPFTFVKKGASDEGVIAHEKFHARVFFYWLVPSVILAAAAWFFGFLALTLAIPLAFTGVAVRALAYNFVETYRLWEEIRAYGIQAATNNYTLDTTKSYAEVILKNYTDGYSQADITNVQVRLVDERARYL